MKDFTTIYCDCPECGERMAIDATVQIKGIPPKYPCECSKCYFKGYVKTCQCYGLKEGEK